jgi:hypothetical protein
MERIIEKNNDGLITKIVIDGSLPTTADIYALNCDLWLEQTIGGDNWISHFNNSNNSGNPNWEFCGRDGYKEMADEYVSTSKIADNAVNQDKLSYVVLAVTVASTATSGESSADATIAGGQILGIYPTGNQDQFVTNVEITEDFKAKVTLGSAATASNTFNVIILKT